MVKIVSQKKGRPNSVDTDQTAPMWICTFCSQQFVPIGVLCNYWNIFKWMEYI